MLRCGHVRQHGEYVVRTLVPEWQVVGVGLQGGVVVLPVVRVLLQDDRVGREKKLS